MPRDSLPLFPRSQWWAVMGDWCQCHQSAQQKHLWNPHPTPLLPLHREITAGPCQPGASTTTPESGEWWASHHYSLSSQEGPERTMPEVCSWWRLPREAREHSSLLPFSFLLSPQVQGRSLRKRAQMRGLWTSSQLKPIWTAGLTNPFLYSWCEFSVKVCLGPSQVKQWDTVCSSSQKQPSSGKSRSCVVSPVLLPREILFQATTVIAHMLKTAMSLFEEK